MSFSRQVLSSPFDAPQRPRTAASRQNGDRKRVKEGGSSLANNSNIMVDTRVVRRTPTLFNASMALAKKHDSNEMDQVSSCILFDSRLIKGDVFANPIVTVTGNHQGNDESQKEGNKSARRTISTPPPVKGRRHISVQTDDTDRLTQGICTRN
ncbi:hypothetical protein ACHAXR_007076 [Thalassiosira sp. AJA248-18]